MKLKLINAERHICPAVSTEVTLKGQTVIVSEEVGKMLLEETRVDALNNTHQVWQAVEEDEEETLPDEEGEGEGEGEGEEGAAGDDKPKRAARAARKAKA